MAAVSEARAFVHELKLKSRDEWYKYCKGELPGHKPKPDDIPASPAECLQGQRLGRLGDWLGTGTVAWQSRASIRPFEKARAFVHKLKLEKIGTNGTSTAKANCPATNAKPDDIPATPWGTYEDKGWAGLGDWLGTGTVRQRLIENTGPSRRRVRSFTN